MIVRASTPLDVVSKVYRDDVENLIGRVAWDILKIRKIALKKGFPFEYSALMTGKSGNIYRMYVYAQDKHEMNTGAPVHFVLEFDTTCGKYYYIDTDPLQGTKTMQYKDGEFEKTNCANNKRFSSHFMKRYEERFGYEKNKMGNNKYKSIVEQFFFRNFFHESTYQSIISAREWDVKDYDVFSLCYDGVMLGDVDGDFANGYKLNTFISYDNLTTRQRKAVEATLDFRNMFKTMREENETQPIYPKK